MLLFLSRHRTNHRTPIAIDQTLNAMFCWLALLRAPSYPSSAALFSSSILSATRSTTRNGSGSTWMTISCGSSPEQASGRTSGGDRNSPT